MMMTRFSFLGRWDQGRRLFGSQPLVHQFLIVGAALVVLAFGALGFWVSNQIERIVVADVTQRAVFDVQNSISPLLAQSPLDAPIPADPAFVIDRIIRANPSGLGIAEFKLWSVNGLNIYDTDKAQIGKEFSLSPGMRAALNGEVTSGFSETLHRDEHLSMNLVLTPVVEIYVPIYRQGTDQVIAIAEFYQTATLLYLELQQAKRQSWVVTAVVTFLLIAGLYGIVARGGRVIDKQRRDLDKQVIELSDLLARNEKLRRETKIATQRATRDQEAQLRRIGADLHDGVGQLITIVILRLSSLFEKQERPPEAYTEIKGLLDDAMSELRMTASGLGLPEIENLSLREAIDLIVNRHKTRTKTDVTVVHAGDMVEPSLPLKLCMCRVVQEALTNAYKHADGLGQKVSSTLTPEQVAVKVSDEGPGIKTVPKDTKRQKLGLLGLRNRLESLGGHLQISTPPGGGTVVSATLNLGGGGNS